MDTLDNVKVYYEDVPIKGRKPIKMIGRYRMDRVTKKKNVTSKTPVVVAKHLLIFKIAALSIIKDILK